MRLLQVLRLAHILSLRPILIRGMSRRPERRSSFRTEGENGNKTGIQTLRARREGWDKGYKEDEREGDGQTDSLSPSAAGYSSPRGPTMFEAIGASA